jgi:C1A family cysteine protease
MPKTARRRIKRYGWIPDLPDRRDYLFSTPKATLRALPPRVDLTRACPHIYDQGELGSCTAQAIAAALQFDQIKQARSDVFTPSRLFIYYNERSIEGTVEEDAGAMLRDGIKSVAREGAPHESIWPYVIARFRRAPTSAAYSDAALHQALIYQRVKQTEAELRGCLASGYPFVFGFSVYESFESDRVTKTGVVPMPSRHESVLGGHAVLAVGYDEEEKRFLVRNSWGPRWGREGYFRMPYAYLLDPALCGDLWMIQQVE